MLDGKAYIVVAQTTREVLDDIVRSRNESGYRNHVVFTNSPLTVMEEVAKQPVDVVVTGQRFYESDLSSLADCLQAMMEATAAFQEKGPLGYIAEAQKHFIDPYGTITGTSLSEMLYEVKPQILVFRYSLTPKERGRIVGDIEKIGGRDDLIDFIDSEELPRVLQDKQGRRLRQAFPKIEFYNNWEQEHGWH